MDKYNSKIAKAAKFLFDRESKYYAITLGQTAYYSCSYGMVTAKWRKHEDTHKKQWARDGKCKFIFRYIWQYITKGYDKIDYEIEATKST